MSAPARRMPAAEPALAGRRAPGGLATSERRRTATLLLFAGLLLVAVAASLMVGAKAIPPDVVLSSLAGSEGSGDAEIVRQLRLPRTLLCILVGVALALAGALMQAFTRNPLADPGLLGVNAGAGFAVVMATSLLGVTLYTDYIWWAFAGAIVVTVVVYLIGSGGPAAGMPARMVLTGVAVGAVLGGIGSAVELLNPDTFDQTRFWSVGTVAVQGMEVVGWTAPFVVAGAAVVALVARPLNAVALGDDLARSLGANLAVTRALAVVGVTLLCGAATAAAGPIALVGFMVPHVCRWIVGPDQRWILAHCLFGGAVLVLVSDVVGRVILPAGELPVGLVTVALGAPLLIAMVRRRDASGL